MRVRKDEYGGVAPPDGTSLQAAWHALCDRLDATEDALADLLAVARKRQRGGVNDDIDAELCDVLDRHAEFLARFEGERE